MINVIAKQEHGTEEVDAAEFGVDLGEIGGKYSRV